MSRQLRSENVVTDIATRFCIAIDQHLGLSASEFSRRMGYANPSTFQAIRNGFSLPDFARLAEYKNVLRDGKGRVLNLHWVITGEGSPLLSQRARVKAVGFSESNFDDIIIQLHKLSTKKKNALIKFLVDFD